MSEPRASGTVAASRPVAVRYDALFVDLDGVVYRGDESLPRAAEVLDAVRALGLSLQFMTNNSSRTPDGVAEKLRRLGVAASPEEVLTSAVATAAMLAAEGASGRTAFVVGERGVRTALEEIGVRILEGDPDRADLVIVGWDRSMDYAKIRTAGLLLQRGARLVATNADPTYPAPDGLWPGAGAILSAVVAASGAEPTVVGKPSAPMFRAAIERTGARRPLVVGDRLDTDVLGAARSDLDSLLVFTGAAAPADLLAAEELPTYAGRDLHVLLRAAPPARFRTARPEDVAGLTALVASSGLGAAGLEDRLKGTVVSYGDQEERTGNAVTEGAKNSAPELVPDATACVEDADGWGLLRSVAVRDRYRGSGVGMLAVAAAVRAAGDRGIRNLALFTVSAAPFFGRLGFETILRSDLPDRILRTAQAAEECPASATAMVRRLSRPA